MKAAYRFLRKVEHRLQMVDDEQTQTLPAEREGLERFARFLGFAEPRRLRRGAARPSRQGAAALRAAVREDAAGAERPALRFPPDADDRETLDRLAELGFRKPLEASAMVRHWLAGGYRSLKGEAAREPTRRTGAGRCSSSWRAPTIRTRR